MAEKAPPAVAQVKIWDPFVRFFHWSLVSGFAISFISAEINWMTVHVFMGYFITALVLTRIMWGLVGSRYARFSNFIYPVSETLAYVRGMRAGHPPHYFGHNPMGALMVFALLGLVLLICASGLTTLATIEFEGPLVFINAWFDDAMAYLAEDIHETLPWITLGFVGMHVTGVVVSSRMHNENLVKSMFTGYKPAPPDSH